MWAAGANERRTRHAARGKESILEAAAGTVAARGLEGARFADIARAAGTAISSLQYAFGSREDLLVQTVEFMLQRELRSLEEITVRNPDPRTRLTELIHLAMDRLDDQRDRRFWLEIGRAAVRNPELQTLYDRRQEARTASFRDAIAEGVSLGLFTAASDARDAALQLLALIDGLDLPQLTAGDELTAGHATNLVMRCLALLLGPEQGRSAPRAG